jgi:predicted transposase YbfD/YdcC
VAFPFAEQAARLTRCVDSARKPAKEIETEYLLSSRPAAQMNAEQMLQADRRYWGIETGLHLRLDVIAGEDRSRVRKRNAVMNLAVIRRAVVSLAVNWIRHCKDRRRATMSGFYDFMSAQTGKKAFNLVTISKPAWLPNV